MTKEKIYQMTNKFFEAMKIWYKFQDNMWKVGLDIDDHWVNEVYYYFKEMIWDLITEYRKYPDLHCEELNLFEEILYDFSLNHTNDFNSVSEIVDIFLTPDFVINTFELGK